MSVAAAAGRVTPASEPQRMPLSSHLREARRRGIRAAIALVIGVVVGFVLSGDILDVLRTPIEQIAASRDASLNFDSVTGAFDLRVRIALFAGIVIASPVWLYELFAYLMPGLTRREKAYTLGFAGSAIPLFLGGCVTGLLIFPHMVELLLSFAAAEDSAILSASTYVEFVMKIMIATGIAFALPVFIVLLNFAGVLSAQTIARSWRWWLIAIVVFSALVTPAADVMSMFLIALPMTALFLTAALIAHLHDRAVARRLAASVTGKELD